MSDFKNNDVKKMLEMLKQQAESTDDENEEKIQAQTTESSSHSDEDIKSMLKKHFGAEEHSSSPDMSKEYSFDSFDTVDFGTVEDETITGEIKSEKTGDIPTTLEEIEENIEEIEEKIEESEYDKEEETPVATVDNTGVIEEDITEETVFEKVSDEEAIFEEAENDSVDEPDIKDTIEPQNLEEEIFEDGSAEDDADAPYERGAQEAAFDGELLKDSAETADEAPVEEVSFEEVKEEVLSEAFPQMPTSEDIKEEAQEDPISEEPIDYDEVLEGQQGTVFNSFVEDFSGDLDDVVFEAEITESRAPDKQYTIFEDWQQLMKEKAYATAEDGIIPPTKEELDNSMEIARRAKANTDYFNPITSSDELDAVDIALMVALGGEKELNQTVGFEKIRQAVHDVEEQGEDIIKGRDIYGCTGSEYNGADQNAQINKKYKSDKIKLAIQTVGTLLLTLALTVYEISGWIGIELPGIFNADDHPDIHILAALQILFFCAALSYNKIIKVFKNFLGFSSVSFICALVLLALNLFNDGLLLLVGYEEPTVTFHSLAAFLFLLSLVYDLFELYQQYGVFGIVSSADKKLVLEPFGKLRMGDGEDMDRSEIIDKDSYCIARVTSVKRFFERVSARTQSAMGKIVSLIVSLSVSLCVMLALLLMKESFSTIMASFILTLSFSLVVVSIFESEFAFFAVYKSLKRHRTGIIGKTSVSEYGKCNIVYFDDFNVFSKKSVRTKGLKLYDNNEIYRVLYHTQAVFSKIGGPLKGVFEFATSEMVHSKSVEVKEISKEGIIAIVDNRTSVLIGTGNFMRSRGIHPKYTSADLKLEENGDESIMFIALNGTLGAKLYVTYQFSAEFEKLARKLAQRGVGIGIRSCDPNINSKWAKRYGDVKNFRISSVRPTLKELKPREKSIEGGVVSAKNVGALTEALMMCIKLDSFEGLMSKIRVVSVILTGILAFALVLFSGINTVSMLALVLACALCASIMMLLTHFYLKH